jgi:hypothetical protein
MHSRQSFLFLFFKKKSLPSFLVALSPCAALAAPVVLSGHHAVYALSLNSSHDQTVIAATGSMTYDLTDTCGGWTTAQHMVIDMTDRDGQESKMVSDYATFETKDGARLNFHSRQQTDSNVTQNLDGVAVLNHSGGHGHADLTNPEKRRVALPEGTLLPNSHTIAIIAGAMDGKRFLSMPLFDGTGADGAQDTFVVIENWNNPHTEKWQSLSELPSGRVHVSFFDRDSAVATPDYEIGMRYFDNGVADGLTMDFGDFVMDGSLAQFNLRPTPRC